MRAARFWLSPVIGISVCVAVWVIVVDIHPIFSRMAASGLVPVFVAGILGGLTVAVISPTRKVLVSFLAGLFLTVALLLLFSRQGPGPRNPWFWYWPIWLVPSYVIGGYLGRRYWQAV